MMFAFKDYFRNCEQIQIYILFVHIDWSNSLKIVT